MCGYHKYVFNVEDREFVGDFEQMYQNEGVELYDSWNQDQINTPELRAATQIIESRGFSSILDIGCGKGAYTASLAKPGRKVCGLDLSKTAIQIASKRHPGILFNQMDVSIIEDLERGLINSKKQDEEYLHLVLFSEIFRTLKIGKRYYNL